MGSAGNHTSRHCSPSPLGVPIVWAPVHHRAPPGSTALCSVPCALRTHSLHPLPEKPPQGCDFRERGAQPLLFPSPITARLIPPHLHCLMRHRHPKPGPCSCLTVTSLRAETGFSISLFPLRNLTYKQMLDNSFKINKEQTSKRMNIRLVFGKGPPCCIEVSDF